MQTKYYLMYRYINPTTNTAITNEADYDKTEEFYNSEHKYHIDANYLLTLNQQKYDLSYTYNNAANLSANDLAENYVATLKSEADTEREQIITENMANENKSNNLYIYTGTKKYFHKQYIPDQLGYIVRDWTKVPTEQVPDSPQDYSKHFVMHGGTMLGIDDAYLVCKPEYMDLYLKKVNNRSSNRKCLLCINAEDLNNLGYKFNSRYYRNNSNANIEKNIITKSELANIIDNEIFFEWYDSRDTEKEVKYGEIPVTTSNPITISNYDNAGKIYIVHGSQTHPSGNYAPSYTYSCHLYLINDEIKDTFIMPNYTRDFGSGPHSNGWTGYNGYEQEVIHEMGCTEYGVTIEVNKENIIREVIPAHYEETGKNPYVIKDTYKKIELSPWMLHSIHNSLEHGIESARKLVSMIGMDNVKMIKYVPFDQFIKIK